MDSNDLLAVLTKIMNSIPFQITSQNTNNMSASYQQQLGSQVFHNNTIYNDSFDTFCL